MSDNRVLRKQKDLVDLALGITTGFSAAALAKTANAPLARVVTLLQTQDANPRIKSVNHAAGDIARYTGIINVLTRVTKEQGTLAHWRGNLPSILSYVPSTFSKFVLKDSVKSLFPKFNMKTQFWPWFGVNMASGAASGAISSAVTYPFHFAYVRLSADVGVEGKGPGREFSGLADCLRKTIHRSGFLSIYKGFGVSVLNVIVYRGAYFGFYDSAIGWLKPKNIVFKFMVAQIVVMSAGLASYPFKLVQHRLIMQAGSPEPIYTGALDCATKVARREGARGLFKGAGANIFFGVSGTFMLILYDKMKELM